VPEQYQFDHDESCDAEFLAQRPALLALAASRLESRSDAEDVVQEAWLRWRQHHGEVDTPSAWLRTVTRNLCVDRLRRLSSRRELLLEDQSQFPEPALGDGIVDHHSITQSMLQLMTVLTPLERVVFVLRECFEWRHSHVARLLGRTEPAVRQVSRRARHHLTASDHRVDVARREASRAADAYIRAHSTGDVLPLVMALAPNLAPGSLSPSGSEGSVHDVVGVLIIHEDRLLLGRRRATLPWYPQVWDLPGSHRNPTEGLVNCMLRASRDELGIAPHRPQQAAAFVGADFELSVFSAASWEGQIRNAKPRQHDTLRFVSWDEATQLPLADSRLLDLFEHAG
jgi:RNA polymerase sigma-70 factor, ECF subfamily